MKHAAIASTVLFLVSAQMLPAQSPAFEVASVRLNKSGEGQAVPPIQPGGRVTLTNRTLRSLVHFAYSQIDSPIQESITHPIPVLVVENAARPTPD